MSGIHGGSVVIASGAAPRVDLCALAAAGFGSKLVSSHVPELVALNTQLSALASVALATDVSVSRCYCILAAVRGLFGVSWLGPVLREDHARLGGSDADVRACFESVC